MNDCIFCKIITGEVPSYKIFEDKNVYAFLDLSQTTFGHTLLVPKKHVKDIFEFDESLAKSVFGKVPLIADTLKKTMPKIEGLNVINNNGSMAGQTIFHSHIHFIPRYNDNDTFILKFHDNSDQYRAEQLTQLAHDIAENIKNEN